MEVKKSKKAEIESHKGTWLLMGFIVVLAFMFVALEWAQYDKQIDTSMAAKVPVIEMVMTPVTVQEKPLPPPPPAPVASDEFLVTDNNSDQPEGNVEGTETTTLGINAVYIPPAVEEVVPDENIIVVFAEVMPSYPGGLSALNSFLSKNLRYPPVLQETHVEGKVIIQFVVDKDGSITNVEVARGVHPQIDQEAIRVINLMPKWNPGMQNRKPVRVKYTVPIAFKLQ